MWCVGLGFRFQCLFRVSGLGFSGSSVGFRVQTSGFRVSGSESKGSSMYGNLRESEAHCPHAMEATVRSNARGQKYSYIYIYIHTSVHIYIHIYIYIYIYSHI